MNAAVPLPAAERERIARTYGVIVPEAVTIKVVPRGASAFALPVWRGGQLISPDGGWRADAARAKQRRGGCWFAFGPDTQRGRAHTRRAALRDMIAAGKGRGQVMAALGLTASMLLNDLRAIGLKATDLPPPERTAPWNARSVAIGVANRERVRRAFDGKRTATEIAAMVGLTPPVVAAHLRALGYKAPRGRPGGVRAEAAAAAAARREKVRELLPVCGNGYRGIAALLGVCAATICKDVKAMGLGRKGRH